MCYVHQIHLPHINTTHIFTSTKQTLNNTHGRTIQYARRLPANVHGDHTYISTATRPHGGRNVCDLLCFHRCRPVHRSPRARALARRAVVTLEARWHFHFPRDSGDSIVHSLSSVCAVLFMYACLGGAQRWRLSAIVSICVCVCWPKSRYATNCHSV